MTRKTYKIRYGDYYYKQLNHEKDYYKKNAPEGKAEEFVRAVRDAVDRAAKLRGSHYVPPKSLPEKDRKAIKELGYQKILLKNHSKFKHTLFYRVEGNEVVIKAIYNQYEDRDNDLIKQRQQEQEQPRPQERPAREESPAPLQKETRQQGKPFDFDAAGERRSKERAERRDDKKKTKDQAKKRAGRETEKTKEKERGRQDDGRER